MTKLGQPSRRTVLASGLAVAGGCFSGVDIRVALAAAARSGKPLFTAGALTMMMSGAQRASFNGDLAKTTDLPGFLGRYFELTDQQKQEIGSIPRDQVIKAQGALMEAERRSQMIRVVVSNKGKSQRLKLAATLQGNILTIDIAGA
jgi:hypothetical protein